MPILLSVHTYRNQPLAQPLFKRFDQLGGALGRAVGNDLVLDDPGKYISRIHARLDYRDGAWTLTDVGSNPSLVNDKPVGQGRSAQLNDGDRLVIGDYLLVASVEPEAVSAPMLPPSPLQVEPTLAPSPLQIDPAARAPQPMLQPMVQPIPQPAALPANPDDSLAGASILDVGGDPLAPSFDPLGLNLFGAPPAPAPATPAYRGAESDHIPPEIAPFQMPGPISSPKPAAPAAMAIPDDYDPLADFLPPRVNAAPPPPPPAAPPVHAVPTPLPEVEAQTVMVPAPAPVIAPAAVAPPPVMPAPPPRAPAPAAPQPPSGAASDNPVIQALMRGMGLTELNNKRSAEEVAELAGAMLREATAGTMNVLMARALTKRESRLDMTMISSQANNPLKFFPDADSALMQMMNTAMPGYMAPQRAFASAFDDIRAHELAIMAGMRAALAGVLKRFDPQAIEARLQEPTVMDKVLASNRKAKMWDRMVELYKQLAVEADDDFQRLFGEAFGQAYEEQVQRLRQPQR
jgi:type VI secretion system FHA domain protein